MGKEVVLFKSEEKRSTAEVAAFLQAQTSPSTVDLSSLVPQSVPSGLPVWD